MPALERFIEIPVIGVLLLLPLLPWIRPQLSISNTARTATWLQQRRELVGALVFFALVVGILGNQLIDAAIDKWDLDPKKKWKEKFKPTATLKNIDVAEYVLADRSEHARAYITRHRAFMRIDRAGVVAMALLAVSFVAARIVKHRVRESSTWIIAATMLLFAWAFCLAYRTESEQYWEKISTLAESTELTTRKDHR